MAAIIKMASKRAKPDVESEDRSDSYLKDGCFPRPDGKHPDEERYGHICLFMVTHDGAVITPTQQAALVVGGVKPHTGENLRGSRCMYLHGKRDASTVPADLYKAWYNWYRGMINMRRTRIKAYERDIRRAQENLHNAYKKYYLSGDWEFGPNEDTEPLADDKLVPW